jgi:hypothetical protein
VLSGIRENDLMWEHFFFVILGAPNIAVFLYIVLNFAGPIFVKKKNARPMHEYTAMQGPLGCWPQPAAPYLWRRQKNTQLFIVCWFIERGSHIFFMQQLVYFFRHSCGADF